jgi:5-methylcytosine-specific restriction protein A
MSLLYYWHRDNYKRDLDMGAGYHLNQANSIMHELYPGQSLWAFTRASDGRYALAVELVVRAKTFNPPNFRYGKYRLWGDLQKSRYFQVDHQPNIEQVIRSLSLKTSAVYLGQSFQGNAAVRRISTADHLILTSVAKHLPLESRARILPEEKLEAIVLLGDEKAVENLVLTEPSGIAERRKEYLFGPAITRNSQLAHQLHELYEGKCQICLWNPKDKYGYTLCHGHHIQWLSRGGEDVLENMALVCPNHHAAIHRCDAPLDYKDLAFDFQNFRETLQLNQHLPRLQIP